VIEIQQSNTVSAHKKSDKIQKQKTKNKKQKNCGKIEQQQSIIRKNEHHCKHIEMICKQTNKQQTNT
jgi:uncharacterized membrane protein